MDAIIRAAAVSNVAFELRRPPGRSASAAPAAAAPAAATAADAAADAAPAARPLVPAAPPPALVIAAPLPAPVPLPVQPSAVQLQEEARLAVQAELAELRIDAERRGYAAGHEKGESAARQQLQSQIDRFHGLAAQMVQAKAGVLEDGEDGVVELAFAALCRVLGQQAATRQGVMAMVAQCAIASREREQVGVRLHPDDFALLGPAAGHQLRFSPDPDIALGGCMVDSSTGALDARLETQLARLAETLCAVRAARRRPEEAV